MAGLENKKKGWFSRELVLRIVSVIALVPFVIYLIHMGGFFFKGLLIIITFLVGFEYERVTQLPKKSRGVLSAGVFATAFWLMAFPDTRAYIDGGVMSVILGVAFYGIGLILKKPQLGWAALGIPYIAIPMFSMGFIYDVTGAPYWLYWLLLVSWGSDTGAYVIGKLTGGPKLVPKISPNKTWAGFVGGMLVGLGFGTGAGIYFDLGPVFTLAIAAVLLSIWGAVGDLFESFIKRRFGVKDSGFLIPGHGGVLDRVDAMMFAAPATAIWLGFEYGYFSIG